MSHKLALGAALILSCGMLAACEQRTAEAPLEPGERTEAWSAVEDAASGAVGAVGAQFTTSTEGFVESVAMTDMYEIEAGQIAIERAQSPEIRAFAQQMVESHTMSSNDLASIVESAQLGVALPMQLGGRHQNMIDNLHGAADEDFDGRYLAQQVNAHREAQILFRGYADGGEHPEVKTFAAANLPIIEQHLEHARTLDRGRAESPAVGGPEVPQTEDSGY